MHRRGQERSLAKRQRPEFTVHRLHTSIGRATVVYKTASLGQTLHTGHPLVDGLSFHDVSGLCMHPWHTGRQEEFKPRVYETPRPMQAWSLALRVGPLLVTRPAHSEGPT